MGRAWHCRIGRWPSSPCSSGHCFWVQGYCSGGRQTVRHPHMSESTGPRAPKNPSSRDLMSEIENRIQFNPKRKKTSKLYSTSGNHLHEMIQRELQDRCSSVFTEPSKVMLWNYSTFAILKQCIFPWTPFPVPKNHPRHSFTKISSYFLSVIWIMLSDTVKSVPYHRTMLTLCDLDL